MADKMQVILKEDVPNLGRSGELVGVKAGFGRNYLIPQGLALLATKKNVAKLEHDRKSIEARAAKLRKDAESIAARVNGIQLRLERATGEGDKLFGSVGSRDIEEALTAKGVTVDRRKIVLPEPIRTVGEHTVEVKLAPGVSAQVKVTVAKK